MKKEKHRGSRTILSSTLLLVAVMTIVYILVLVVVMNGVTSQHMIEQKGSLTKRMQMALQQTEHDLGSLAYWERRILQTKELQKLTYMYEDLDWYSRFSLQRSLHSLLVDLKNHNSFVENAWLYIPRIDKTISNSRPYASKEGWFSELSEVGVGLYRNAAGQIIYMVSDLTIPPDETQPACVFVQLDTEAFESYIRIAASEENEEVRLHWIPGEADLTGGEESILAVYGTAYPIAMTLRRDNGEDAFGSHVTRLAVVFTLLSMLVALIGMLIWRRRVYVPLEKLLTEAFEKMRQGDFHYRIQYKENSPFAIVFSSYNQMMEKMEYYVENDLKQQILVSRANLKQLQSQINPHFMYNSYYILYRLIKRKDEVNALKLAEYLGKFFQYVTRNADDEKKLSDEIDHARNYAVIQQFRFRDAVDIQIDEVPDAIASVYVPRLILQPILENAFNYVYEVTEGQTMVLRIRYEVRSSRDFDVIVENGGTVQDSTIEGIRAKLEDTSDLIETTALVNIHRRLQIYFSRESGLSVERSVLGGLCVRLHIVEHSQDRVQAGGEGS